MSIFAKFTFIVALLVVATACKASEKVIIKTPSGDQAEFSVAIADLFPLRQRGLMFVEEMKPEKGMLFVFEEPQEAKFWMKNTLIPLDMLFFTREGELVHIEHSAQPHDETPRGPDVNNICSVLEINGGLAKSLNIPVGSKIITNYQHECLQSSIK